MTRMDGNRESSLFPIHQRPFTICLTFALALAAAATNPTGTALAAAKKADDQTVKLVKLFLKTPTPDLPTEAIDSFLAVDEAALPKKMQTPYEAKKLELYSLQRIAERKEGKKLELNPDQSQSCAKPMSPKLFKWMSFMGFESMTEEEEGYLMRKTRCSELELMCDFTLTIVIDKKNRKKPERFYFIQKKDPLDALLASHRNGDKTGQQTAFFGISGYPTCR